MGMRRSMVLAGVLCGALAWSMAVAAGPDAYGYRSIASTDPGGPVVDSFVDISTTGTRLTFVLSTNFATLNADEGGAFDLSLASLNGGAGFPFYGALRPAAHMTSNGFLGFTFETAITALGNQCSLPNTTGPSDGIAVLWDDLVSANPPDDTRGGFQQSFATCPYAQGGAGACVIFEWYRSRHFGGGGADAFTFQAVLYDSGNILLIYRAANPELGSGSTTGIEGPGGLVGLTHVCNTAASVPDDSAVLILAPADGQSATSEVEPNDDSASATTLVADRCGGGSILDVDTVDNWRIAGTTTEDRLFAYVDTQFAGASDATLAVVVGGGDTAIATDDNSGPLSSPVVAGVPLPLGGDVFLRVTPTVMATPLGPYALMTFLARPGDVADEVEPNDAILEARPLLGPVTAGTLERFDLDHYVLDAEVGDVITVIVDGDPDGDGENTRTELSILGPNGIEAIGSGDFPTDRKATAAGRAIVTTAGQQLIRLRRTSQQGAASYEMVVLKNCAPACSDGDGDGTCDGSDNCAGLANDQADTDGDGLGDACDACAADPAKVAAGTCGCGVADADANGNGVLDCLANAELRERLDRLTDAVTALQKTKRKKPNPSADETRTRLENVAGYLRSAPAGLVLTADANGLASDLEAVVGKALKGGAKFGKKKKKALAAVQTVRDAVAP